MHLAKGLSATPTRVEANHTGGTEVVAPRREAKGIGNIGNADVWHFIDAQENCAWTLTSDPRGWGRLELAGRRYKKGIA